ncbi:unnamed protein product [Rotaria magnacalcarata]|uniref:Uncharacterized protein n=1 Tax=Rotaria magnacalcarata TaxID=392030 RepID=A0A815M3K6_9BILA|nr:unnamed protein product [Rotaria magnacalcarata]
MSLMPIRQYLIVVDFLSRFKARKYSVYDPTGQHLQYRIESKYNILQTIELIAYPRKNVTGKLQARINPFVFQLRTKPFTWVSKHDMEIYSNAIPDAVYLLGLAAKDGLARRESG